MIRYYPNEKFKQIEINDPLRKKYAISNYSRLVSYTDDIRKGMEIKGALTDGYRLFRYKFKDEIGKIIYRHYFYYKLIADHFLPKTGPNQNHVIHLDYVRDNDKLSNLKWVTYEEMLEHINKSPGLIENRRKLHEFNLQSDGVKMTVTKVMRLKKMLQRPEQTTRKKIIAKQFNISQTQLKRIETGENWGHVKV